MRQIKARRICIICEGFEEYDYMNVLTQKKIFSDKYSFTLINSKSNTKIIEAYIDKYRSNSYDLVLIFCDTDKGPSKKYLDIKQSINNFYDNIIADNVIIFGNPCTMQIILSHFGEIKLTSQSKAVNSKYIKRYTGIDGYDAKAEQRKTLFSKINRANYAIMKNNIEKISTDDNVTPSTNILEFLKNFENDDDTWIDRINDLL